MPKNSNKHDLQALLLFLESDDIKYQILDPTTGGLQKSYTSGEPVGDDGESEETEESAIQVDADDSPAVSDSELESALEYDNVHYGEFDKTLEKK